MNIVLSSERLLFRKITYDDYIELCKILQNVEIMYAWEHAFTDEEVLDWIKKNLSRYEEDGFSFFAAIDKNTGAFIGVIGPLIETIEGERHIGIAYILAKEYWGRGYASEGAAACIKYAFDTLKTDKVIAEIRPNNTSSLKVAERIGMRQEGEFVKIYKDCKMPHLIYSITKEVAPNERS